MKTSYSDMPAQILDRMSEGDPRLRRSKKMKAPRSPLKAFCATLQRISNKTHRTVSEEFKAFCGMAACALSNTVDQAHKEEREKRYLALMNVERYDNLELRRLFPELLQIMIAALEEKHRDFLGEVYVELDIRGHEGIGQIWSPYPLCQMTARMTLQNAEEIMRQRGYISVYEPAVGTGVMAIAAAETLLDMGFNPQTVAYYTARDVDLHAVHMAYIQMTLYGLPARIVLGDTLKGETREEWFTWRHFHDSWGARRSLEEAIRLSRKLITGAGAEEVDREQGDEPGYSVILSNPPWGTKWERTQNAR